MANPLSMVLSMKALSNKEINPPHATFTAVYVN